ncbi:MAG: amino acid adenylation domain-containing protein [Legionellaceae bacterium]|nr:amino acid adenylation domain-containing protein [Legionellaceae bacterium]MBP9775870.1 amino acid adenylation domain-containing protein [Legionellaceae bacterium]
MENQFNCYLIGDGNLVIKCANILLEKGHLILGMASSDTIVETWIKDQKIPCLSISNFEQHLIESPCDYLFSINNQHVLPKACLTLPKYFAINYHDALLPKYAGIHATSWAILNGEEQHGISWHVMTQELDAGDILKQAIVEINNDETALSLNLKCFDLAITAFSELIEELASRRYKRTPQELSLRSYFGRHKKPPANGWVDWNQSAHEIDKLCRALQFGNTTNRLASAKISIEDHDFIVDAHHISAQLSDTPPGTVVNVTSETLQISTKTYDLILTAVRSMNGTSFAANELCDKYKIKSGSKLKILSNATKVNLEHSSETRSKYENFWVNELNRFQGIKFPFFTPIELNESQLEFTLISKLKLDQRQLTELVKKTDLLIQSSDLLLTLCLIYFYRLNNQSSQSIGYHTSRDILRDWSVVNQVPMNISFNDDMDFFDCAKHVQNKINMLTVKQYYARDVYCRYPSLLRSPKFFPISVALIEDINDYNFSELNAIIVVIESSTNSIHIFVNESSTNPNLVAALRNIPGHIKELLSSLTTNNLYEKNISRLNFLTKKERTKILTQWNATTVDFPQDKTVHQLFEEQALKTPHSIAVDFGGLPLTYAELNQQSNQFAHYLRRQGVKPETLVVISLKRGLEMIIAIIGILKAGGAYVPVDPDYPEERIKYILDDCQAMLFITQHSIASRFSTLLGSKTKPVILDEQWPIIKRESIENLTNLTRSNHLIYLIYTSGSTGKPKGVLVEHKGVVNCILSIAKKTRINSLTKFLATTSLAFDVAALDYFLPLSFGASVTIASEDDRIDGERLIHLLIKRKISAMQATPSTWQMLILGGWLGSTRFKILTAGEALPPNLSDSLQKCGQLFNIYGPTETSIYATFRHIKKTSLVDIGKPIANTQAYVLNQYMALQPIGVLGELYIGGVGLARGYLNRDDYTKNNFLDGVVIDKHKIRVYKTGDLVRWLPDGSLDYMGRIDNQVKIRGYRIELGEIEQALLEDPGIVNAIVLPFENNGQKKLIAYVQRNSGLEVFNQENLRNNLAKKLPAFMIPSSYMELNSVPLNTNGKVDRNKLLQIYHNKNATEESVAVVFKTKIEAALYGIWQEVLNAHPLFVKDNFFSLGGDSILAMQIVSKARQSGIYCTVKQIFLHPTIRELAVVIKEINPTRNLEAHKEGAFPLAPIQSWFFEQNFVLKEHWSQVCLVDIVKSVDTNILYQSLKTLVSEHDALRIRFYQERNVWKQHYADDASILFHTVELESLPNQKDWEQLSASWQSDIQNTFNLEKGPLVGAVLFTIHQVPQKLLLVVHHLVVDGVSWRILIQDLYIMYGKNLNRQFSRLNHTTASYKSWVLELHQYADSSLPNKEKKFWLQQQSAMALPKDFDNVLNIEEDVASCARQLSLSETQTLLKQPIHDASLRINDLLLTILARTFELWTKSNCILIDMESHGREELENNLDLSHTVGWFTSLYPLYLVWPAMASIDLVLDSIKKQIRLIPNNGIMYGVLRYLNNEPNHTLKKLRAEISFNYWGQFQTQLENDTFQLNAVQLVSAKENKRPYIIDINCWIVNKQFHISFTYNKTHYKSETIRSLVESYIQLMRNFLLRRDTSNDEPVFLEKLGQSGLNKHKNIKEIYPLAPIQKGMLFHMLRNPESEAYSIQLYWQFNGKLDVQLYQQAWEIILHKYDVFRTSFLWDKTDEPAQMVHDDVALLLRNHDWSGLSKQDFEQRWEAFLKADRQVGFNLTSPPLIRLALISASENVYLMLISLPHLIIDGWCIPILLRELSTIYQTLCTGDRPDLILSRPYSCYIQWLQKQDLKIKEDEIFWRNYLLGFHSPTDLVIAKNYSAKKMSDAEYQTTHIELSTRITKQITQFAKKNRVTLNTIFQGLWGILIARYSQADDIVFGITLSTRSQELVHSEDMMGLFINTIPMRIKTGKNIDVLTYLNLIQINFTELQERRYTPLTEIENWSDVSADSNLFESVMVFENYPVDSAAQYLFDSRQVQIHDPSHYPIVFYVTPGNQFSLRVNYDSALISEKSIERLVGHLQTLLNDMVNHPKQVIAKLALLTDFEYKQFLENAYTPIENLYLGMNTPHQIFEQRVNETPDRLALIFEEQQVTYRQLNEKSNQLAHYLRQLGVKAESIVAICIERSIDMIVGILGILKAGGAYLPIDPIYPDMRIEYILAHSKTQHFLLQQHLFDRLKNSIPSDISTLLIDSDYEKIKLNPKENLSNVVTLESLMYVIYTSGSTGKPKGVLLEQRNVLHLFNAANQILDITKEDRWTLFHSIAFDFSVWEIWGALLYGGLLVIVPHKAANAADDFYRLLIKNKITILSQTPSAFHQLALIDNALQQNLFLRFIIFDGEVLSPKVVQLWFASHNYHQPKLINMYGITETTVHLTHCEITPEKLIDGLRYPIGKGLPGVALYVLDEYLQPVPIGVPGELYVAGNFLARGYVDKELTQKRFINTSFDHKIGSRFYKTGDLARRLEYGDLDYLGRIDNQVKFRGYRIELDEVITWIEKYPGITNAIVVIHKGKHNDNYFIAYIVANKQHTIETKNIKTYLHQYLPNYMIPDLFIFLDSMPLTSNGKIDKQALPLPDVQSFNSNEVVHPRTPEEKILVDIWKKVLKLDNIGVYDNFFDLGGHSLLALKLLLQIKRRFSIDLPVRAILDASTIAELATLVANNSELPSHKLTRPNMPCLIPLQPEGNRPPLFLIHPIGGTIFWYLPLVKHFGKNQPLYGIQDPGIEDSDAILFETLEQMASFYIKVIQSIQPQGPYLLGGASGGSIISFEMTRQLLLKGEQVDFVGLLDGWVPHPEQLRHEEIFEATMRRQYNLMSEKFKADGIDSAEKLLKLQWQRAQLLDNYKITSIEAKLTLFKANEITSVYQPYASSPLNHWENYSTHPIKLHHVSGDHETMFQEPHATTLSQLIMNELNNINKISQNVEHSDDE